MSPVPDGLSSQKGPLLASLSNTVTPTGGGAGQTATRNTGGGRTQRHDSLANAAPTAGVAERIGAGAAVAPGAQSHFPSGMNPLPIGVWVSIQQPGFFSGPPGSQVILCPRGHRRGPQHRLRTGGVPPDLCHVWGGHPRAASSRRRLWAHMRWRCGGGTFPAVVSPLFRAECSRRGDGRPGPWAGVSHLGIPEKTWGPDGPLFVPRLCG